MVVRLDALLRAQPAHYDQLYRSSPEVERLICSMDGIGLWFSLFNHAFIVFFVHTRRSDNSAAAWGAEMSKLFIVAALLQLLVMHRARTWYCKHRFVAAVANRVARQLQACAMILQSGFNATSSLAINNSKPWQAMQAVPGVQQLAGDVCYSLHGVFESVLALAAAGAGVSTGTCGALDTAARTCSPELLFEQLVMYASLVLSYFVPLFLGFIAELHHKRNFWKKCNMEVELQRSVLLPLPGQPLLSHALVLVLSPVLLWFVAEQAAPFMAGRSAVDAGACSV
ncbi:hypothetical protein OEZ85_000594 [Tetradesmus obliquus]|uniref:THH1/TOM1/TOM3 domain-containing protein n=1 Tax=Tetradesmus obliquus TaxID=3088 RepID=A0ABY8UJA1_TETOB|nr:hypothetical protein OEZ85_000594 [Tetradesmus obliquus]